MMLNPQLVIIAFFAVSACAVPLKARDASDADIARLAPALGFQSGINPTGYIHIMRVGTELNSYRPQDW